MIAWVLFAAGIFLAVCTDLWMREITRPTYLLLFLSGLIQIFAYGQPWAIRVVGALLIGAITLILAVRKDGLGGGDVKMMAAGTFAAGVSASLVAFTLGTFLACLWFLVSKRKAAIPLAPFLAAGYLAAFIILSKGWLI